MKDFIMITGAYPPDVCGVGYGVNLLMGTPTAQGWDMYYSRDWSLGSLRRHIRAIDASGAKYILMQYPTQGYGRSLVPHLLSIYYSWFTRKRFGAIIHEQSQKTLKGYLAEVLILVSANRLIFTNVYEREYAVKRIPFAACRSAVVKIFSQIESAGNLKPTAERTVDVVNFGLIFPVKGIEQFVSDVSRMKGGRKAVLAGMIPDGFEDYFETVKAMCAEAGIEIRLNLSDRDISLLLNDSKVAYLPYPDGISERRGSALASMLNGAVVATNFGRFTTADLAEATVDISERPLEAVLDDAELLLRKQRAALAYMDGSVPRSVDEVAAGYDRFIRSGK